MSASAGARTAGTSGAAAQQSRSSAALMAPNKGRKGCQMKENAFRARRDQLALHGGQVGAGGDPGPRGADPSVLRPALAVSVTGLKQAVQVLEKGTPEVRHYLLQECNVLYECKVCLNLFRSLANWIAHKRSFCKAKIAQVKHVEKRGPEDYPSHLLSDPEMEARHMETAVVEQEEVDAAVPDEEWDMHAYAPSLELLKEAGFLDETAYKPQARSIIPNRERRKTLENVIDRLKTRQGRRRKSGREVQELGPEARFYESDRARGGHTVLHERIRQTGNAVFQNLDPDGNALTMGQRYRELQELKKRPSVFLGPDGKLIDPGPAPARYSAFGSDCKENSRPGEEGRLTYECPICRKKFLKFGGVERHIKRYHNKSGEDFRRLKTEARKNAIRSASNGVGERDLFKFSSHDYDLTPMSYCSRCGGLFSPGDNLVRHATECGGADQGRVKRLMVPREALLMQQRGDPAVLVQKVSEDIVGKVRSQMEERERRRQRQGREDAERAREARSSVLESSSDDACTPEKAPTPRPTTPRISTPSRLYLTPTKISLSRRPDAPTPSASASTSTSTPTTNVPMLNGIRASPNTSLMVRAVRVDQNSSVRRVLQQDTNGDDDEEDEEGEDEDDDQEDPEESAQSEEEVEEVEQTVEEEVGDNTESNEDEGEAGLNGVSEEEELVVLEEEEVEEREEPAKVAEEEEVSPDVEDEEVEIRPSRKRPRSVLEWINGSRAATNKAAKEQQQEDEDKDEDDEDQEEEVQIIESEAPPKKEQGEENHSNNVPASESPKRVGRPPKKAGRPPGPKSRRKRRRY